MSNKKDSTAASFRPPIVAVLGHVDHGKTTLLDTIRKTNVAGKEHGGITQHIGAYQILVPHEKKHSLITFIDTPGHEAFMKMRARGAKIADIAILVVASDDSVMPQTKESIRIIKEAGIPFIVVVNKIDLPSANVEKVKQDLARNSVQVEGFGGDVPIVSLSAKAGTGIDTLFTEIMKLSESLHLSGLSDSPFSGIVVETRVDKGKGMVATLVVKQGILTAGTPLYEGETVVGKVRAMFDEYGKGVREAPAGKPVEVLGFSKLPGIGTEISKEPIASLLEVSTSEPVHVDPLLMPDFLSPVSEQKKLALIIKTDTAGSREAILSAFTDGITIVSSGVGDIVDADVLLAKSTGAFVIGFNVKVGGSVQKLAETEGVVIRIYTIIYELINELTEVLSGMQEVLTKERELGKGTIIAEFPFDGERIAGVKVTEGRVARGDQVKVFRDETEVGRAKIKSVRFGKEDITKAETGKECGVLFDKKVDFQLGDAIIAFIKQ